MKLGNRKRKRCTVGSKLCRSLGQRRSLIRGRKNKKRGQWSFGKSLEKKDGTRALGHGNGGGVADEQEGRIGLGKDAPQFQQDRKQKKKPAGMKSWDRPDREGTGEDPRPPTVALRVSKGWVVHWRRA